LYTLSGQELKSLGYNPAIVRAVRAGEAKRSKLNSIADTLSLDFFEDFSTYAYTPFPSYLRWSDSYAYVNSTFADSMISIGVATLDAYDQNGVRYRAINNAPIPSDTLTSRGFIFNVAPDPADSVFLSFFYQAGGKGEMPDIIDTLLVDFYSFPDNKWVNTWKITGGVQQHTFTQVILPVDTSFLKTGFRFRFRNYTSIKQNIEEMESNADQWNLDYIQLKHATNSNEMKNLDDVAIMEPLLPSLTEYSSVPYRHLPYAQSTCQRQTIPLKFRTYYPERAEVIMVSRTYISNDLVTGTRIKKIPLSGGLENEELPSAIFSYNDFFTADLNYRATDTIGKLELVSYIAATNEKNQRRENDTVRRREYYYDYYAYDDGSAEFGFGISGENQDTIQIAYKYRIYRKSSEPDTLRGVYIYFNKTLNFSTSDIKFKVCVWKNNGAEPGQLLYQSYESYTPDTIKGINQFTRYDLDNPVPVSDTIFVGIKQPYAKFINIGYDINYNSLQNIYVKTNANGWYNPYSIEAGSLMIRPSFGNYDVTLGLKKEQISTNLMIYPNPAKDVLFFESPDGIEFGISHIKVLNILGMTLIDTYTDDNSIDISSLNKGLFLLIINPSERNMIRAVKFIKD
jgi:hypothetical protein